MDIKKNDEGTAPIGNRTWRTITVLVVMCAYLFLDAGRKMENAAVLFRPEANVCAIDEISTSLVVTGGIIFVAADWVLETIWHNKSWQAKSSKKVALLMSTAIPLGFRVSRGIDVFKLQQSAQAALFDTVRHDYTTQYAKNLIAVWDSYPDEISLASVLRTVLGIEVKEHKQETPGHYLYHKMGHYLRTENNDNILDPFFSMVLWSPEEDSEYMYGSFSNSRKKTIDSRKMFMTLQEAGLIEEFAYWNGSNSQISDGDLTEDEWYERGDIWRALLYRGNEELTSIRVPIVGREALDAETTDIEEAALSITEEYRKDQLRDRIVPYPSVIRILEDAGVEIDVEKQEAKYEALASELRPFSIEEFQARTYPFVS